MFTWLGFTVKMERDQTAEQMKTLLKEYGSKHHGGDCFVCCILSHGATDGVLGTDRGIVSRHDIFNPFYDISCSSLRDKPKVFFIQACRGNRLHPTEQADDYKEEEAGEDTEEAEYLETDDEKVILDMRDFFIARSTIKGYYSMRNEYGTWFIQSLCNQLKQHCPQ